MFLCVWLQLAGLRLSGFRYSSDQSKDDPKSRQYIEFSVKLKELPNKGETNLSF